MKTVRSPGFRFSRQGKRPRRLPDAVSDLTRLFGLPAKAKAGTSCLSIIAAIFLPLPALAAEPTSSPLPPAQEQESFQLADRQLVIELAAAEPNVISPVAIAWDADGRMFVAEMSDYPNAREKGRIKRLEDRDGDGFYETAVVFADQLPFPNGVLPWRDGILATAAPDIWFLSDTNGDGVADVRRKLLTGFGEGNQQLRVNGLFHGLDNWIYGANGRSDGEIRWVDEQGAKERPISIRGHDFRFRPEERRFEAIAGRSQFGHAQDDWGNRYLSWNTLPIRHQVVPQRYLARNPFLAETESVCDLLDPNDDGRVYPLTPPPLTFNNESTSHFNALAGLTIFRGDGLGENYRGNAFVGESLRNLVHRRVLAPNGPTFLARRGEQGKEFLASKDPWFHPVNFATGPDGGLYVVDFYRRFVEHPDWVQGPARGETAWQTGAAHGRLWRIRNRDFIPRPAQRQFGLARASAAELVEQLASANAWWRETAQRLLVERGGRDATPFLEERAGTSSGPETQVHSLYTLAGLGFLTDALIESALSHPDARTREHALALATDRLANRSPTNHVLSRALPGLQDDPDPRVRLQLALALGQMVGTSARFTLARLAERDFTNRWHALAILSSLRTSPWLFLQELVTANENWLKAPTTAQVRFLDQIAQLIGANHNADELSSCVKMIESRAYSAPAAQFALLAGLGDGFARAGRPLHRWLREAAAPEVALSLRSLSREAALVAGRSPAELPVRLAAWRFLVQARTEPLGDLLLQLLQPNQPLELQSAAARAVGDLNDGTLAKTVFAIWTQYRIGVRRQLLSAALGSPASTVALIDALEWRTVSLIELDASTRQALRKIKEPDLQTRVRTLLENFNSSDRESVIKRFQPALSLPGDRPRGAELFAKSCLSCHWVDGQGARVGPELSGLSSRPPEAVLVDILDPSRQVSPDFLSYTLTTAKGDTLSGVVASETTTSITLRRQNQPDEPVLRTQIKEMQAEARSLMPDGLEQGFTLQDFADLLAFLRQPSAALLPR